MKNYMTEAVADAYLAANINNETFAEENSLKVLYPDFPESAPIDVLVNGYDTKITSLTRRLLAELENRDSLSVLDLGAGFTVDSLYYACKGHSVTVYDDDFVTQWHEETADKLGVADRYVSRVKDARDISSADTHDVIQAKMLLHFFNERQAHETLNKIQEITPVGGYNVISVYTEDNPEQEKEPPRDLAYFFGTSALRSAYLSDDWEIVHYSEGPAARRVSRSFIGKGMVLIPTVAEILARRVSESDAQSDIPYYDFDDMSAGWVTVK